MYQTRVTDLAEGNNQFIWKLTDAVGTENMIDTILILYTPFPLVQDDKYTLNLDVGLFENVVENDILNTYDYTTRASLEPLYGIVALHVDGSFEYQPDLHFFREDKFVYELCNNSCPDECVEATVLIDIGEDYDCFVPLIFSPNEDGKMIAVSFFC